MKAFITLAVFCLVASALATHVELSDEQKAKAKGFFDECAKQENLTEEEIAKVRSKDYTNPSKNVKCFGTCFFEKTGTLKDGKVQADVVLQKFGGLIGEEKTKAVLEKCKDVKGKDRCDTGFQIFDCFHKAKAELNVA